MTAVANAVAEEMEIVPFDLFVAAKRRNGAMVRNLPGIKDKPQFPGASKPSGRTGVGIVCFTSIHSRGTNHR